jgi:hypothetical protein
MTSNTLEHAGIRYQIATSAENDSATWIELQCFAVNGSVRWTQCASASSSAYMPCGSIRGPIFDDVAGTVTIEASSEGGRDGNDPRAQRLVIRIVDGVLV